MRQICCLFEDLTATQIPNFHIRHCRGAFLQLSRTVSIGCLQSTGNDAQAKSLSTVHRVTPYVKAARMIYASAFQSSSLKAAFPKLMAALKHVEAAIDDEREAGPIDFQELCVKMTLDTIGLVALDANLGGLDGSREIHKLLLECNLIGFQRVFNFWTALCCKYFPNSPKIQQQEATIRRLTAEWDRLTAEISKYDDPPHGENPIWHGFKSLVDPETGKSIPYKSLRAEIAGIVLAGMDTTGHQLAWILAMLASHPRVVEKLLEEMEEHGLYGPHSRDAQFDDLVELKYLNAVIKEGMRIASTTTGTFPRFVERDMEIMGYQVPKGTVVLVPSSRWLGSESDWGDPEVVRPERWLGEEDMTQKHYLGFSSGPRDCVGQKLAMLEMRAAIVYLLRRYELKPVVPFFDLMKNCQNGVTIEAVDGICLHASKRA